MTDTQWQNVFDQIAHALAGYSATLTFFILYPKHWMVASILTVGIWAAVKEFWYDAHYEDASLRGSNLVDFSFYIFGLAMSLCLCAYA